MISSVSVFFMIVKTSVGVTGSIIAVLIAFLGISIFTRFFKIENVSTLLVLLQTAGSASGSVAAASLVLLAAHVNGLLLTGTTIFLILLFGSVIGVLLAIPLRKQFIETEKLPFPSGTACYELIAQLCSKSENSRSLGSLSGAFLIGAILKAASMLKQIPSFLEISIFKPFYEKIFLGISTEPLTFGIGLILGFRVAISLMLSATLFWIFLVPLFWNAGIYTEVSYGVVRTEMLLPVVFFIFGSAFVSLIEVIQNGSSINFMRKFRLDNDDKMHFYYSLWWGIVIVLCVGYGTFLENIGFSWLETIVAIVGSLILAIISIRILGSTDINPLSMLSNSMMIAQSQIGAKELIVPASVTTVIASTASDTMQDFKTGWFAKVKPRFQYYLQFFGVFVGSVVIAFLYVNFIQSGVINLGSTDFPAPTTLGIAALGKALSEGHLITQAEYAIFIFLFLLGILYALALKYSNMLRMLPNSAIVGVSVLLPLHYSISIGLGGVLAGLLKKFSIKPTNIALILGTGLIAADAVSSILLFIW